MELNGRTKFECKRVYWRLKRCYLNALSCNDVFQQPLDLFESDLNV